MSIIKSNNKMRLAHIDSAVKHLKDDGNHVYVVTTDPNGNYELTKKEQFVLPSKIYGSEMNMVKYWLKTHKHSKSNTGILLAGTKGTGKTITAKMLCLEACVPVIIINQCFKDEAFIDFISSEEFKDCIIFIDEFEKIYVNDDQQALLSLMDGAMSGSNHNIFLLTSNSDTLNTYLENRPGRIRYYRYYETLEDDIIKDVCNDMLLNNADGKRTEEIMLLFKSFDFVTFDILISVIGDMNLHNVSAKEAISHMYITLNDIKTYDVTEVYDGKPYSCNPIRCASVEAFFKESGMFRRGKDLEDSYEFFKRYPHSMLPYWSEDDDEYTGLIDNGKLIAEKDSEEQALFTNEDWITLGGVDYTLNRIARNHYELLFPNHPKFKIIIEIRAYRSIFC